jgi:hypothetical protein
MYFGVGVTAAWLGMKAAGALIGWWAIVAIVYYAIVGAIGTLIDISIAVNKRRLKANLNASENT